METEREKSSLFIIKDNNELDINNLPIEISNLGTEYTADGKLNMIKLWYLIQYTP